MSKAFFSASNVFKTEVDCYEYLTINHFCDSTYMFACHIAYIPHVHDATLVSNHADSDGVFAHLRRHVLVDLDA